MQEQNPEISQRSIPSRPVLSVDSLRRSSPHVTPNRTLRLSEAEHALSSSSRDGPSPLRVTVEALSSRPRSNPRTRTPRRYESPLNPDEFRRVSITDSEEDSSTPGQDQAQAPANVGARRITIRPLAGTAVGTTVSTSRIPERRVVYSTTALNGRSRKQGPSHRKIRRWNNDRFRGLASEVASASSRGLKAADAILKAQGDAHLYRDVYDPSTSTSEPLVRFFTDEKLRDVRESYLKGEIPFLADEIHNRPAPLTVKRPLSMQDRLNRVDARLRRVVVKAVCNSYPAARVLERFEAFLLRCFISDSVDEGSSTTDSPRNADGSNGVEDATCWDDLLLEAPTVSRDDASSKHVVAHFYFDPESSTGGFHRLLLHACAQFHGLEAWSRLATVTINGKTTEAKALTAKGAIEASCDYRLLDACEQDTDTSS